MKLLLTSSGFTNSSISEAFASLVGKELKDISLAVINEAYAVEHDDHRWVIDELNAVQRTVGGNIEIISLLANDKAMIASRINQHDAIYVLGGHTDYLMHVYIRSGFSQLLPELLQTKTYVGSSAGSMVAARRISTDVYKEIYGEGESYGVETYLDLVDFAIKPHLGSDLFPQNRQEVLSRVSKNYNGKIYAIADDAAIEVNDGKTQIVGGSNLLLENGEIIDTAR